MVVTCVCADGLITTGFRCLDFHCISCVNAVYHKIYELTSDT